MPEYDYLPRKRRHMMVHRVIRTRHGSLLLETIVGFVLISALIGFVVPLTIQNGRIVAQQRHYRLALEELTNQLEQLRFVEEEGLEDALRNVEVSDFTRQHVPGAQIMGTHSMDERFGTRLTLSITWNERGRSNAPLVLSSWRSVRPSDLATGSSEDRR